MFIIMHNVFAYVNCNAICDVLLLSVIMSTGRPIILNIIGSGFIYVVYVMCFFDVLFFL